MVAIDTSAARSFFSQALPDSRLGQEHASLEDFRRATKFTPSSQKEYTLIVVTEYGSKRILLGQKHRGFGQGMYNSFGGKVEAGESVSASAVRELKEETGICVTKVESMSQSRLGTLWFTFDDDPQQMVVHLFRINIKIGDICSHEDLPLVVTIKDASEIRGCEEITPIWFDDWAGIPLDNMFADDSVWLTYLLSSATPLLIDGWFHFRAGGQEKNSMLHYYLELRPNLSRGIFDDPDDKLHSRATPLS